MVFDCLICRLVIEALVNSIQVSVGIGAGSREPGAGSRELGARSWEPEDCMTGELGWRQVSSIQVIGLRFRNIISFLSFVIKLIIDTEERGGSVDLEGLT